MTQTCLSDLQIVHRTLYTTSNQRSVQQLTDSLQLLLHRLFLYTILNFFIHQKQGSKRQLHLMTPFCNVILQIAIHFKQLIQLSFQNLHIMNHNFSVFKLRKLRINNILHLKQFLNLSPFLRLLPIIYDDKTYQCNSN